MRTTVTIVMMMVTGVAVAACDGNGDAVATDQAATSTRPTPGDDAPDPATFTAIYFADTIQVGEQRRYTANLHCGVEWLAGFNGLYWKAVDLHAHDPVRGIDPVPAAWIPDTDPYVSSVELVVELVDPTTLHAWSPGSPVPVVYQPADGWSPCE